MDVLALIARTVNEHGVDPDNINTNSTDPAYIGPARKYCEIGKCPIEWATIQYRPTIPGNVIYLLCFLVLLGGQLFYGIRKKTWTYMGAVSAGVLLEIVGYIGRIMLNQNPFIMNNFLTNLIPLTLAPALLTAGIYLCLGRVIVAVGTENSRLKPKMYTYVFVGADLLSLVLQSIGGAMAATGKDAKASQRGTDVMIGGLVSQVISMALFFAIWLDFVLRTRRNKISGSLARTQPPLYAALRSTKLFTLFQWSLFIASVTIFIRCIYRVAELWEGFDGYLANHEETFMIFEGPMIIIAVLAMTIYHPGRVFDNLWAAAGRGDRGILAKEAQFLSPSSQDLTDGDQWDAHHSTYRRV